MLLKEILLSILLGSSSGFFSGYSFLPKSFEVTPIWDKQKHPLDSGLVLFSSISGDNGPPSKIKANPQRTRMTIVDKSIINTNNFQKEWLKFHASLIKTKSYLFSFSYDDLLDQNSDSTLEKIVKEIKSNSVIRSDDPSYIEEEIGKYFLNAARAYEKTNRLGSSFKNEKNYILARITMSTETYNDHFHVDNTEDHATMTLLGDSTEYLQNSFSRVRTFPNQLVAARQGSEYTGEGDIHRVMRVLEMQKICAKLGLFNAGVLHREPNFKERDRIVFIFLYPGIRL